MTGFKKVATLARFAALFAVIIVAGPARAADPIFPAGSRIGMVPPAGMVPSITFEGFRDPDKNAAILITTLPAEAYAQLEKNFVAETLKKQGVNIEKREAVKLRDGKGFLIVGDQVSEKTRYRKWVLIAAAGDVTALVSVQVPQADIAYTDAAIRAALTTLIVRGSVPEEERLQLLPFKVEDFAGFHVEQVLPGRALMLGDAPKEASASPGDSPKSRMVIIAAPGGPAQPEDRDSFARIAFNGIGGLKDIRVTLSEPLRVGGQPGYQTLAEAKEAKTGTDVRVVQWLRFGSGGFMQMVGVAPAEVWVDALARLRTVRDSIELR